VNSDTEQEEKFPPLFVYWRSYRSRKLCTSHECDMLNPT